MKPRPDIHSMPILEALPLLTEWVCPHLPPKLIHSHEKISDAELVAVAILRYVRKIPYFKGWWKILTLDLKLPYPSLTQAHVRLKRLISVVEKMSHKVEDIDFVLIDSAPIPTCRYKRASKCKFPGASFGYGTQGKIFGYKIHAWVGMNGKILNYALKPANEHDFKAGCDMNGKWADYSGPKMIGDKAYYGGGYIVPPKSNTKNPDPRWKEEFHAARKMVECAFSSLVGRGLRWGQVKTWDSLRLKVACLVTAYNLRFADLTEFLVPANP